MSKEITIIYKMQTTETFTISDDIDANVVERECAQAKQDPRSFERWFAADAGFDDVKILDMKYFVREKRAEKER